MNDKNGDMLFEKFEIIECLKKDDHAAVYIANHIYLNKKIILKILNTQDLPDSSILLRFKREAKLLAQLEHPNIIKVLDFGTYENYFYISFEYFESKNLRVYIRTNGLTSAHKKNIVLQLLKGLSYAHEHNIVHRDLKPENILIAGDMTLKIGDFGLAISSNENYVTSQDAIVGTPCYMSPEQVRGERLTNRSDLFSVGLVIYELYTGKNPLIGKDVSETINNVNSFDEKLLINELANVPSEIQALLARLVIKDIDKRIPSAHVALGYLGESDNEIRPTAKPFRKITFDRAVVLSVVLFIIISTAYVYFHYKNGNISVTSEISQNKSLQSVDTSVIQNGSSTLKDIKSGDTKSTEQKLEKSETSSNPGKSADFAKVITYGRIGIECKPWADVYIDSLKVDTTPLLNDVQIQEGEHLLRLVHPNYPVFSQKIIVSEDKRTIIKVNLDTLFGFLECNVHPWSEIYVNGNLKGETPLQSALRLIPGNYRVTLKNRKFSDVSITVKIEKNKTFTLNYNFEKKEND